tara:strand:- start:2070 stop:2327 length:258 start_codon:yes stop_codon:yes gene_type:complete
MAQASDLAASYRPFVPVSTGEKKPSSDSLPKQVGDDPNGRKEINNDYYDDDDYYDEQWDHLYDEAIEQSQKRKREKSSNKNNDTW